MQLIRSRDLARAVATKLDLASRPEFDQARPSPHLTGSSALGLGKKRPASLEERVLDAYYKKLSVYAIDQSRVIGIDFSSTDPQLAADVANAIADEYHRAASGRQSATSTSDAADWLSDQIVDLRVKVQDAEAQGREFPRRERPLLQRRHDRRDACRSSSLPTSTPS